jgi:hypothetical protein
MANTTPIDAQTDTARIPLASPNLDQRIKNVCDTKAAAGYELSACFAAQDQLVLIFQLTR